MGLSTLLAASRLIPAQEPKAAALPKAIAADPKAVAASPGQAVDRLVEQLRRYPARPSTGNSQVGLFLIDAGGGEATLIANEPDPWLNQCGSPSWSHDGRQILFHARNEGFGTGGASDFISRVKALDLADGRLEIKDLGPGNNPDLSPSDDRVIFLLNLGS